jgi:hypothetical protein
LFVEEKEIDLLKLFCSNIFKKTTATHHYRQILPELLEVLDFRSNNNRYKPLIDALSLISAYLEESDPYYPVEEDVPLDGVIQQQWHSWIYQQVKDGNQRIRRVRYELCVLQTLREKLRCKEIWLTVGNRFRNPDEDVPADFSTKPYLQSSFRIRPGFKNDIPLSIPDRSSHAQRNS